MRRGQLWGIQKITYNYLRRTRKAEMLQKLKAPSNKAIDPSR
jgi:hypothetical protein